MDSKAICSLVEAYNSLHSETSLAVRLSRVSLAPDTVDQVSPDLIFADGLRAGCYALPSAELVHIDLRPHENHTWLPLMGILAGPNAFYSKSDGGEGESTNIHLKLILQKPNPVPAADLLRILVTAFRQVVPNFGAILSIANIHLPYAVMGDVYCDITFDSGRNCIKYCNILAHSMQIGYFENVEFDETSNGTDFIESVKQAMKRTSGSLNVDTSLQRNGLDSLQIASLEYELRQKYGDEVIPIGMCLKAKTVRELVGFVNGLRQKTANSTVSTLNKLDETSWPLSEAQKQLLALIEMDSEAVENFVEEFEVTFNETSAEDLQDALKVLIQLNPILRLCFDKSYAKLMPESNGFDRVFINDVDRFNTICLNPTIGLAFAFLINQHTNNDSIALCVRIHHILLDGRSIAMLIEQLLEVLQSNDRQISKTVPLYRDYAIFESKYLENTNFKKSFEYWKNKISSMKPSVSSKTSSMSGSVNTVEIPPAVVSKFNEFTLKFGTSAFSTFYAIFRCFMHKLHGPVSLPVLIAVDNRLSARFKDTLGLFVNLVISEIKPCLQASVLDIVKAAEFELTACLTHSTIPFHKVLAHLRQELNVSDISVPEVMLVHDRINLPNGCKLTLPTRKKYIQASEIWYLREFVDSGRMEIVVEARDGLLESSIRKRQLKRFVTFMEKVFQTDGQCELAEVDLLTAKEDLLFFQYRELLTVKLPDESVIDRIWRQLKSANEKKVVLRGRFGCLTALEPIQLVTDFEQQLRVLFKHQIGKNKVIGLAMDRSPTLIALVLACWRLKLAPLMIADEWPVILIRNAVGNGQNIGLMAIITDRTDLKDELECVVLDVNDLQNERSPIINNVNPINEETQIAYLTFTSGSTGFPKAVASTEIGLRNIAEFYASKLSLAPDSIVYNVVNPAFDIFFADLTCALYNGGALYLASSKLPKLQEIQACTHSYIMPAYLNRLDLNKDWIDALSRLKAVLYGGETINKSFLKTALDNGIRLFQQFGVTEHAIYSNGLEPTTPGDNIIVGTSFQNYHTYLVDSDGCRLPPENVGATNGLFRSAGIGVSLGYVDGHADNQRFGIERWANGMKGWKYFDSGDRMSFTVDEIDGNPWSKKFVFLGRSDSIIKIRGNQVDLTEIQRVLSSVDGVIDTVVLYDKEAAIVVAALVLENEITLDEITTATNNVLPASLVPSKFVTFDKFPLNSNGKVDGEAVLRFISQENAELKHLQPSSSSSTKPEDELLATALLIFSKHLNCPKLTPDDNLLLYGADSLKLLMALNEFEDATGVKISLKTVFTAKTLQKCLEKSSVAESLQRPTSNVDEKMTSIVCQHLWFLTHFEESDNRVVDSYHLRFILKFKAPIKVNLMDVIKAVLQKHVILRTLLIDSSKGDDLVYKILPTDTAYNLLLTKSDSIIEKKRGFDLTGDLPIAVKVSNDAMEVVCHHIAVDGWSLRVLVDDIATFLKNGSHLPADATADLKYFEFAHIQRDSTFADELTFFKEMLTEVVNFAMPTDYERSNAKNGTSGRLETTFFIENADEDVTNYESTSFAVILAVYAHSFFRIHGNYNVLTVGVPFANRKSQFSETVGYFVNSLPVVIHRQESMPGLIGHVQEQLLRTTENSAVPFELVIQNLNPRRDPYKHAVFQVMVIFEDIRDEIEMKKRLEFEFIEVPSTTARFEQTWRIKRIGETDFKLEIEYMNELFQRESVESMKDSFLNSVDSVFQRKSTKRGCKDPKDEIKRIWARFLDVEADEILDETNFFEIGGHSLTAVRVCQALSKELDRSVPVKSLFEHQKFGEFCDALNDFHRQQEPEATELYPVNPLQIPLLKKLKLNPDLTQAYTHKIELQLPPNFDETSIEKALTSLCRRHTCLCLSFTEIDGKWFMRYRKPQGIKLVSVPAKSEIDIHADNMLRAYRNPEMPNVITLEISHLVADGHSMNILAEDLHKAASGHISEADLPSYLTFSKHFGKRYQQKSRQNATFWRNFLQNSDGVIESDSPRGQSSNIVPKTATLFQTRIRNGASVLSAVSSASKVAPFAVLMHSLAFRLCERLADFNSTFRIAFCKDLRSTDESDDYFQSIGHFVGTFVIPVARDDNLVDTAFKLAQIGEHTAFTVDDIASVVAESGQNGSLFDVMLVFDNALPIDDKIVDGFKVIEQTDAVPKSSLTFFVQNNKKNVNIRVEYDGSVWSEESVKGIVAAWMTDLHCDYKQKCRPYQHGAMEMVHIPQYPSLQILLIEAFRINGSKTAFLTETDSISYDSLLQKVLNIANFIRKTYFITTGTILTPDTTIPVIATKSVETWLICLGIIFAGAAYLPIDWKLTPIERMNNIFTEIQPLFIVSEKTFDGPWKCVLIDSIPNGDQLEPSPFTQINNFNDLAYAILTSGTTGPPKAVAITQFGVINMIADAANFLKIDSTSVVYQFTNFCFDNSVLEVFATLAAGATLFIPTGAFNSVDFVNAVTEFGVTHAMLFPGLVNTFTDAELAILGCTECWVTGAEKLPQQLFERFLEMRTSARIVQNYGPTETTAYILRKELIEGNDPQNLGAPMPGAKVRVVRPDGFEVAVNGKGELHVAGCGLMRGYIGRKVQPFVEFDDEPGIRYYPTGDICMRLPSNEIKFVGRRDNQVKIRGFRVELDEIDTTLAAHPNITASKAVVDPNTGQDIIAFFIEKSTSEGVNVKDLRNFLKSKLPYYAIPRKLVKVDSIPLTANSKIDVDALLKQVSHQSTEITSNLTRHSRIRQIWSNTLHIPVEDVNDTDDFFYFGGNSLNAVKMLGQIAEETGVVIDATNFFRNPIIGELEKINQSEKRDTAKPLSKPQQFPLSFQQEQMLYLSNLDHLGVYNLAFVQEFKPSLNLDKFKQSVFRLIRNNDILRTKICEVKSSDGVSFVQEVLTWDAVEPMLNLDIIEVTNWAKTKTDLTEFKRRKFDLFNELPLRCKILRDCETRNIVVVLIVHHIASDGFSTGLIESQLKQFYEAGNIAAKQFSCNYGEYAVVQRAPDTIARFTELMHQYTTQFEFRFASTDGFVSLFDLLQTRKPKEFDQNCRTFQFEFPTNRKLPATAFSVLINAIRNVIFSGMASSHKTLIIAAPCANRSDPQFSTTLGNFLTTLIYPANNVVAGLKQLESELLSLSKYAGIPFNLVSKQLRRKFGNTVLDVQVLVNCRYNIEDEKAISTWSEAVPTDKSTLLIDTFPVFVNYPVEIDLDEYPDGRTKVTIRVSESFYVDSRAEAAVDRFVEKLKTEILTAFKIVEPVTHQKSAITLIAQCLNVPVSEVNESESFFDNGGDSFALWRLHRSVQAVFDKKIELSDLIKAESVGQMIAIIEMPKRPTSLSMQMPQSTVTELFTRIHLSTTDPLGVMIIFVYPLIGGSLSYTTLITKLKLLDKARKIQTIVGLAPPRDLKLDSLEKLAKLHLSELNRRYLLSKFSKVIFIGASFGASLGFELAKQLSAQLAIEKPPPKATFNRLRVATFKVTSRQVTPDPRRHSVALGTLPSAKPARSTFLRTRPTESKVKLISIDGTIRTVQTDIPTIEEHKKQITQIAKRHGVDESALATEIETSWKLLNMAALYSAKPVPGVDILLLRVRRSIELEMVWREICGKAFSVGIIPANHENMLMEPHVDIVAQKAFVWI